MGDVSLQPWMTAAATEIREHRGDIAEIIERHHAAYLETLPVAEPCDHASLLRECSEVIERASRLLPSADDRLHAAELLDRVQREVEESE